MGKKTHIRISLGIFVGLLLGWLLWNVLFPSEPVYQGKKLTFWLDQYRRFLVARDPEGRAERDQAETALGQIGSNALPALMRMVGARDSALKQKIAGLARKQKVISVHLQTADNFHSLASFGFGALRSMGKPAVPALVALLNDKDLDVRASAANCLACIGPEAEEAVPALLQSLADRNNGKLQFNAMMALGSIGKKPESAVPTLMEYLNGSRSNWGWTGQAIRALGFYSKDAAAAVPAIQQFVNDPDANIRSEAQNALWRITGQWPAEAAAK